MKFKTEAEMIIIGSLYSQPERLFTAGELTQECYGRLTTHQIGSIISRLVKKKFLTRIQVAENGWQTRYGANEEIVSNPEGNLALTLYGYLSNLFP